MRRSLLALSLIAWSLGPLTAHGQPGPSAPASPEPRRDGQATPSVCKQGVAPCIEALHAQLSSRGSLATGIHVQGPLGRTDKPRTATVASVIPGGPADRAGLKPGEVVVAINGERLGANPGPVLRRLLPTFEIGQEVTYTVLRGGVELDISMTTEAPPEAVIRTGIANRLLELFGEEEARRYLATPGPVLQPAPGTHDAGDH